MKEIRNVHINIIKRFKMEQKNAKSIEQLNDFVKFIAKLTTITLLFQHIAEIVF